MELILIRGIPGSGKSTFADSFHDHTHFETDMFFVQRNGKYIFDPKQLEKAHQWCKNETINAIARQKNIVISNTFIQFWEMEEYLFLGKSAGYSIKIIEMTTRYESVHDIPIETLNKMKNKFEEYPSIAADLAPFGITYEYQPNK